MLFNSLAFVVFFAIVTTLYFAVPHGRRWGLLLAASCFFYMYAIPVYILILIFTIVIDYVAGILIEGATGRRRKAYLGLSIAANVGVLAFFKYFNFVNANLAQLAALGGFRYPIPNLEIVLPVELERVYEDAHDERITLQSCGSNKGAMAVMQRSHCRNEPDGYTFPT